ncbi:hypothetical protein [Muricoccus aerilatus]|nr:hypothetical protein [Roseomonas aerilata]
MTTSRPALLGAGLAGAALPWDIALAGSTRRSPSPHFRRVSTA